MTQPAPGQHKPRVALVGWGAIGRTVGTMLDTDIVDLVAVGGRRVPDDLSGVPASTTFITNPSELAAYSPTVVAEAASRESVEPWGRAALACGADFIISSTSALVDTDLLRSLQQLAKVNRASVHIQPGALGGVDALAAAKLLGIETVEHRVVKPPGAWLATPAEELCDLENLTDASAFFSADAAQVASAFPKNANVAMITALAGVGPEATTVTLVADPAATTNRHEISASGAFGTLDIKISNNALPDNPKTSAMAALNLARAIHNRGATLVI